MNSKALSEEMQQQLVDRIVREWFITLSDLRCSLERDIPVAVFEATKEALENA
jgi:hypothetical protein